MFEGIITNITIDGTGEAEFTIPEESWWTAIQARGGDVTMKFDATGGLWTLYDGGNALSLPTRASSGHKLLFAGTQGSVIEILSTTGVQS